MLILGVFLSSAVIVFFWNTQLICFSDGRCIPVEKSWIILDEVFYEDGEGSLFTVEKDCVSEILTANLSSLHDWQEIFSHAAKSRRGILDFWGKWGFWAAICVVLRALFLYFRPRFLFSRSTPAVNPEDQAWDLIFAPVPLAASDTERVAAEKESHPARKKQLEQATSGISALELLSLLFEHARGIMTPANTLKNPSTLL